MISYSTRQRAFASALHERLQAAGCAPKLDHLDVRRGDRWRRTIAWWLSACETAVILLSADSVASPWVRYELGVLANREIVQQDVTLVLVYLGISRASVVERAEFAPFDLDAIQAHRQLPGTEPDDAAIAEIIEAITATTPVRDAPIDRLVGRVRDEVADVGRSYLDDARRQLSKPSPPVEDPWLTTIGTDDHEAARVGYARALCATPLHQTFGSLEVLARRITSRGITDLIDLNVMTTFDTRTVASLHEATCGRSARRALVAHMTSTEMAEVATRAVPAFHVGAQLPAWFVLNGPITGFTHERIATGLADELRDLIVLGGDTVDDYLAYVARRNAPVYAVLTDASGLPAAVLAELEDHFPGIVFVVLAAPEHEVDDESGQRRPSLAERLGVDRAGPELTGEAWDEYARHERAIATERTFLRQDLRRVKDRA